LATDVTRSNTGASAHEAGAGTLYTLLAALGFSAVSTFTQIAMTHGSSLWNVQWWRFVIGALVMIAFVASQRYPRLPRRDAMRWIVLGGGGEALLIGMALSSLQFITVATLAFLFYTYPAWVAVVQVVRGAERLNGPRLGALVLSFCGVLTVAGFPMVNSGLAWQGVALGLGAAVVYAVYIPLMQWMQRDHPVPLTSAHAKVGSAICFLILALGSRSVTVHLEPVAWAAILGLAILSTVLPAVFFIMGLMRLGPVRTAIVSTVEPFITAIFGAVVLNQRITATTVLGGALIVGSVVLLQMAREKVAQVMP
jgi:drug/metabolite transporter (DMT)-like permease